MKFEHPFKLLEWRKKRMWKRWNPKRSLTRKWSQKPWTNTTMFVLKDNFHLKVNTEYLEKLGGIHDSHQQVKEKQIHCSLFHSITYRNKFACDNNIWAGTSVSHPIFTPISNNTDVNVWTHYLSNFLIQIVWIQAVLMFTYCKNHDEKKKISLFTFVVHLWNKTEIFKKKW